MFVRLKYRVLHTKKANNKKKIKEGAIIYKERTVTNETTINDLIDLW